MIAGIICQDDAQAYPLDATLSEMTTVAGYDGKLSPSLADTKGSYTTTGSAGVYGMAPTNLVSTPQSFSNQTGKKAVEWLVELDTPVGGIVTVGGNVSTSAVAGQIAYWFIEAKPDGTFDFYIYAGSSLLEGSITGLPTTPSVVGLLMNGDTSEATAYLDGSPVVMAVSTMTESATCILSQYVDEDAGVTAGASYSVQLITTGLTGTYPPGTTDIFGN